MQHQDMQGDLNKKWEGQTLYNQAVLEEFQRDFWAFSYKEAKSYCRNDQQCQDLIQRMMAEMSKEYGQNPLPGDIYTEIIVRLGLLYGKSGPSGQGFGTEGQTGSGFTAPGNAGQTYGYTGRASQPYTTDTYSTPKGTGSYTGGSPYGQTGGRTYAEPGSVGHVYSAGAATAPGRYAGESRFAENRDPGINGYERPTGYPPYGQTSAPQSPRNTDYIWNPATGQPSYNSDYGRNAGRVSPKSYTPGSPGGSGSQPYATESRQNVYPDAGAEKGPAIPENRRYENAREAEKQPSGPVTVTAGTEAQPQPAAESLKTEQPKVQEQPAAGSIPVQPQQPYAVYVQQVPGQVVQQAIPVAQPGVPLTQTVVAAPIQPGMAVGQIPMQTISVQPVMQIPVQPVIQTSFQPQSIPVQKQVTAPLSEADTENAQKLLGINGGVDSPEAQAVIAQAAQLIQAYNAANKGNSSIGVEEEKTEEEQVPDVPVQADPSKAAGWQPPKTGVMNSARAKEKAAKAAAVKTSPAKAETVPKPVLEHASQKKQADEQEEGSPAFSVINTVLLVLAIASVSFLIWETGIIQRFL